jgi:carboxyl-terminal processing protease
MGKARYAPSICGILLLITVQLNGSAFAQSDLAQAWTWCVNQDKASPDLQIGGCTTVIQSGKLSQQNLTISFNNRGNAYLAKSDYDRAIADYDQAIKLDRRYTYAYHNRGLAYHFKKDYDRAIADYGEAVRLNQKYAEAFNDRGLAYQAKGNLDQAIADYERAIQLNPKLTVAISNRDAAYKAKNATAQQAPNAAGQSSAGDAYRWLSIFGDVFERARRDYVKKVDDWKLIEDAVQGLLKVSDVVPSAVDEDKLCESERAARTTYSALNCFGLIYGEVRKVVAHKVGDGDLVTAAISSMITGLDPHSQYIEPKAFRDMQSQTRGEFGSIGVELSMDNGIVRVVSPIDNTPASRAGVMTNDIITKIDDESPKGLSLDKVVGRLRGAINSSVKITIVRKGMDKPIELTMAREIIRVEPVRWHAEGDQVGYIRISQLNEQTTDGLKSAINGLKEQLGVDRIKGLVIDLRNNPGGLLDEAVSVTRTFLARGEIASIRGRDPGDMQRFNAKDGDLANGKPLIVLINGGTAAGAEIVAGALQDHRRATVLGTRSFGGGSVQTIIPLGSGNGALRLTTAMFFTPSGRSIQANGIVPDIEVLQDIPEDQKSESHAGGEAALPGHLSGTEREESASQSYVPPNEKDDKALQFALDLLRGVKKDAAYPPSASVSQH